MDLKLELRIECREGVDMKSIGGPASHNEELEGRFIAVDEELFYAYTIHFLAWDDE